jgi:hypothetical protein
MAWASGIVLVVALALATGVAVLVAIAVAIEVLPSHPGSRSEPVDDLQYPACGAAARGRQANAVAANNRRRAVSLPYPRTANAKREGESL